MKINIEIHKQYFTISSPSFEQLVTTSYSLTKRLTTYKQDKKYNRFTRRVESKFILDKKYFIINYKTEKIHFIFSYIHEVLAYYKNDTNEVNIIEIAPPVGDDVKLEFNDKYTLRDYQVPFVDKITTTDKPTFLLDVATGDGKTMMATYSMFKLQKRFAIFILPRYIDKWIEDLETNMLLTLDDIYIVKGGDSLRRLMAMSKKELKSIKAIIFSLKTTVSYIREYLDLDKLFTYTVNPEELMGHLGIGYSFNDESHQEFHNVFLLNLVFDVNLFLGITATLVNNQSTVMVKYYSLFPKNERLINTKKHERYIEVLSFKYRFEYITKIRSSGPMGYSHIELEKSISRFSSVKKRYMNLINKVFRVIYVAKSDRVKGDKTLIFVATVSFASDVVEFLQELHPEYAITKYTAEDDYSVIDDNDVIVSTIGSAGTALDISNLTSVIQTVAIDSVTANKQTLGRLRELKDKRVIFAFIWSPQIPSHFKYSRSREFYFKDKAKFIRVYTSSEMV